MGKIAFTIGPFMFHWYGLIIAFSVFIGMVVTIWQTRVRGKRAKHVINLVLLGVPSGIITARLYYVAANWKIYAGDWAETLYIWHGGLAIYGAIIGTILVVYLYTYLHKISFGCWLDVIAPGMAIGQAIGLWGNFINQEAFGYPTDASWGIYIDFAYRPIGYEQYDYFHPAFLYESCWNIFLFLILLAVSFVQIRYKRIQPGSIFLLYIILYSFGRFLVEGIRLDSEMIYGFRLTQIICVLSITAATWLLLRIIGLYRRG